MIKNYAHIFCTDFFFILYTLFQAQNTAQTKRKKKAQGKKNMGVIFFNKIFLLMSLQSSPHARDRGNEHIRRR